MLEEEIIALNNSITQLTSTIERLIGVETIDDLDKIAESHEPYPMSESEINELDHVSKVEIQGTDSRSMELIRLSRKMGYPYLVQDNKLIVDHEVLNAYSRENS